MNANEQFLVKELRRQFPKETDAFQDKEILSLYKAGLLEHRNRNAPAISFQGLHRKLRRLQ